MKRWDDRGNRPGRRRCTPVIACSSRASRRAGGAGSAGKAGTGSASAGAAGFSGTPSTAPRPSTSGCPSRRTPPTQCPTASPMRTCSCCLTSCRPAYEVGVLDRAVRPGDVVAVVGFGPIGLRPSWAPACSARTMSLPSIWPMPGSSGRAVRCRHHGEQQPRGPARGDRLPDRWSRRGYGHRGRRRARGIRARGRARPAGRSHRQRGCTWPARHLHLEEQWAAGHHDHDGARRYEFDTDAPPPAGWPSRSRLGRFITHRFGLDEFPEAYDVLQPRG